MPRTPSVRHAAARRPNFPPAAGHGHHPLPGREASARERSPERLPEPPPGEQAAHRAPAGARRHPPAAVHTGTCDRLPRAQRGRHPAGAWHNEAEGIPAAHLQRPGLQPGRLAEPARPELRLSRPDLVASWHTALAGAAGHRDGRPRGRCAGDRGDAGWDEYLVVGWSLGVNIALELAAADDRVAGVLALAGVPGGTFENMLPLPAFPRDVASLSDSPPPCCRRPGRDGSPGQSHRPDARQRRPG